MELKEILVKVQRELQAAASGRPPVAKTIHLNELIAEVAKKIKELN